MSLGMMTSLSAFASSKPPAAWTPASLSGLAQWLTTRIPSAYTDAGATTLCGDGDLIYRWLDQSGNARHKIQATSGARPAYRTNIQSGNAVVRGDGVGAYLKADAWFWALTAATIFYVTKNNNTSNDGCLSQYGQNSNFHFPFSGDGKVYDNTGTTARKDAITVGSTLGAWNVYCAASAANWKCWQNGTQLFSTGTNTVGWAANANATTLLSSAAPAFYYQGDIGEVIVYDSFLADADRVLVQNYLQSKWGTP